MSLPESSLYEAEINSLGLFHIHQEKIHVAIPQTLRYIDT